MESYLQRSCFDSVHFFEFSFFLFKDRYRMGKCVWYVTCSYWETKTFRDWDTYTWPNDTSTNPLNKIDEHSPVHHLIPYHLVCWALASSKQQLSYVLPKAFLMYQRRACYCDRHSFSWDEIKTITLKLRLTFVVKDSTLTVISYHCG